MLQYYGMLGMPHSWGVVAQSLLREFKYKGVDLVCRSTNKPAGVHPDLLPHLVRLDTKIKTDVSFSYTIPPNLRKIDAKHKIQIYNYETTILPPGFANLMNTQAHLILPSSQFAKEIFQINGVKEEKMVVVPHGYDHQMFHPEVKPITIDDPTLDGKFKFLMIAAPHWRKGHDIMLKAYLEEFKNDEDVALIIKTSMNSHEKAAHFHIDLDKLLAQCKKNYKYKWPTIKVINHKLDNLAGLYTYADAMVLPTRAECFSLTPLEAIACKTPVITTEYGGQLDFLSHDNSYLIDYVMRKCPPQGQYHKYQKEALHAEPSVDDLKRLLRHVKNNYEEAKQKAELAYQQNATKYTWENAAVQVLDLIKERGWKI